MHCLYELVQLRKNCQNNIMATLPKDPEPKTPSSYLNKFDAGRFYFIRHDAEEGYAWFRRDDLPNENRSPFRENETRYHWASMIGSC